ncbi:MAG TPA: ABC transporter substrate-binding protein [Stellaceae bacterium]|nr:ABC transporter substrate-binding protein [Stellaceae bacterium]
MLTGTPAISQTAQTPGSPKVLRVVPQGEVKVFDPHQSQVNLTSMHAALVYDLLFSWDADMVPRPQLVESWTISDDKLLYTFTLRPGLKFSDGSKLTTRDVVATLKRLFLRDSQIQSLAQRVAALEPVDDRVFTLRLKEPFRFVEFLLGGSNGVAGGIMREKEATTDPFTPIGEIVGSGPFRFVKAEYQPGARIVYEKNPYYSPRSEVPSGFAGGKLAKVDRVEFIIIPDATVAVAALRNGEVDFIDSPSLDVVPTVANDPNIVVGEVWPIETYVVLRPNSIQPPFNNVKARQALAYMSDQREYMTAAYGDQKYWRECYAYWVCGSPNGTEIGSEDFHRPNLEKARQLMIESGYKGEKVVLIGGADVPAYNILTQVTADRLKKIGINVDLQMSDWGTVSARRAKKDPPDQGGWNLFHTSANGAQLASPLASPSTIMTCDGKNFVGWPCDEQEEALRQQYIRETDPEKQKALVEAMHKRLWEVVPYVPLGQLKQPFLWRKSVSGVLKSNTLVFWNIEKS